MPERLEVLPLAECQILELREFLLSIFGQGAARLFTTEALHWKAFAAHPFREGPRSYIARYRGTIVAHAMLVPLRWNIGGRTLTAQSITDWAASRDVVGSGITIYQSLAKYADLQLGIGGTEDARKVFTRIGYRTRGNISGWILPCRPLSLPCGPKDWKTPLRMGRDLMLRWNADLPDPIPWKLRRAVSFDPAWKIPFPKPAPGGFFSERTPELLNYYLSCPVAPVEGYVVEEDNIPRGFCLLSFVHQECRIAELWVDGDCEAWRKVLSAIVQQVGGQTPQVSVIAAQPSSAAFANALVSCRFRLASEQPIFINNKASTALEGVSIHLPVLENDSFYL